jgi:mercuric ion transport protein
MENKRNNPKLFAAGIITALGASLCCITPVLTFIAGIGGATSAFSWLDPFRPFLIGLTLLVLAFAWYQQLKDKKQALSCNCENEEKKSFVQSKAFLGIVTVLTLLLLSFPYYSSAFFPKPTKTVVASVPQANLQQAKLEIKGMTCAGCESSVNHALFSKKGVVETKASYQAGMAKVMYDPTLTNPEVLKKAIEEEVGYTVTNIKIVGGKNE